MERARLDNPQFHRVNRIRVNQRSVVVIQKARAVPFHLPRLCGLCDASAVLIVDDVQQPFRRHVHANVTETASLAGVTRDRNVNEVLDVQHVVGVFVQQVVNVRQRSINGQVKLVTPVVQIVHEQR